MKNFHFKKEIGDDHKYILAELLKNKGEINLPYSEELWNVAFELLYTSAYFEKNGGVNLLSSIWLDGDDDNPTGILVRANLDNPTIVAAIEEAMYK